MFRSIQGEGRSAGRPVVFVRSSLCNLSCTWCDTDYTWNWVGTPFRHERDAEPGYRKYEREREIVELEPAAVAALVARHPLRDVVVTGGEPLLQQRDWIALMRALRERDASYRFEVETNGTLVPDAELDALVAQYNVSPKLANAGVDAARREVAEALRFFARCERAFFKLVVGSPSDVEEALALVERQAIPRERVDLMPKASGARALDETARWLADLCAQHGVGYSDRLHVRLWGDERGR